MRESAGAKLTPRLIAYWRCVRLAYLGEGNVDVKAALAAIREIGFEGHIVLETGAPSKDIEADLARNVRYLRGLL